MTYPNIPVSNEEPRRDFFDCPNCWGYQEYEEGYVNHHALPAEERYLRYVHLRTNLNRPNPTNQTIAS